MVPHHDWLCTAEYMDPDRALYYRLQQYKPYPKFNEFYWVQQEYKAMLLMAGCLDAGVE